MFVKKSSCVFLRPSFMRLSFCVRLSLLLLCRCDAVDDYITERDTILVGKSGRKRQQETDSCISSREDTVVSVTLSSSLSVAVPSFFLSLSFRSSPSFLLFPSFLPSLSLRCNTFVGQMHSEQKKNHPFSRYRAYLYYCEIS